MKKSTGVKALVAFIKERQAIFDRRSAGQPKPWTDDPILLDYKFTNVQRENDRVTIWIAEHWRTPHAADPDLWFAMTVARFLNRPTTLELLGYPARWKAGRFVRVVDGLKAEGVPAFSGAYMISTGGHLAPEGKATYLADRVLTPLWKNRAYIRPRIEDTLESFHGRLIEHYGVKGFLGAQVVADMKYVKPLLDAEDWWSWAAMGPGSRRGLNRVLGRSVKQHWNAMKWKEELEKLHKYFPDLHAQDLQNCLCEFDKYQRVLLGEGRMKSRYNGRV